MSFRNACATSEPGIQGGTHGASDLDSGPGASRRPGMNGVRGYLGCGTIRM
jgi:hypothetical protein